METSRPPLPLPLQWHNRFAEFRVLKRFMDIVLVKRMRLTGGKTTYQVFWVQVGPGPFRHTEERYPNTAQYPANVVSFTSEKQAGLFYDFACECACGDPPMRPNWNWARFFRHEARKPKAPTPAPSP